MLSRQRWSCLSNRRVPEKKEMAMKRIIDKEKFIQEIKNNVKNLYRKTLEEASQQEVYQAVSNAVKNVIIDQWLATQRSEERRVGKECL